MSIPFEGEAGQHLTVRGVNGSSPQMDDLTPEVVDPSGHDLSEAGSDVGDGNTRGILPNGGPAFERHALTASGTYTITLTPAPAYRPFTSSSQRRLTLTAQCWRPTTRT